MNRIPRDLIRHLEWTPDKEPPSKKKVVASANAGIVAGSSSLTIDELADRYVISPVPYRGGLYQLGLGKELIDDGETRTQDDWNEFLKDSEWQLPSGPLALALYTALYDARVGLQKKSIGAIQKLLRKDFTDHWMATGTRIMYSPDDLDRIVHEYGTPEAYTLTAKVVGPDGWVTPTSGFEDVIDALLGTRDLVQLEKVAAWASAKKPYLWRINDKPSETIERALVLGVNVNVRFVIGANGNLGGSRPARGVAVRKILSP